MESFPKNLVFLRHLRSRAVGFPLRPATSHQGIVLRAAIYNDFGLETKARFPRKLSIFSQSRLISFKVGTEWKKGIFAEDIPKFLELVKRYRFMIREFAVYRYDLQHLSGTFVLSWKSETPQKDIADSMDKDYDYLRHSVESLADGNPHQIIVTVILKTSSYDSEP